MAAVVAFCVAGFQIAGCIFGLQFCVSRFERREFRQFFPSGFAGLPKIEQEARSHATPFARTRLNRYAPLIPSSITTAVCPESIHASDRVFVARISPESSSTVQGVPWRIARSSPGRSESVA